MFYWLKQFQISMSLKYLLLLYFKMHCFMKYVSFIQNQKILKQLKGMTKVISLHSSLAVSYQQCKQ